MFPLGREELKTHEQVILAGCEDNARAWVGHVTFVKQVIAALRS